MGLAGELLSLLVALSQEISIIAGVGALTITLVGHLVSLHARVSETMYGYVRAARHIRALALMAIIISGGAAILIHFQTQTVGVLFAPAFIFKWLLIALLTAFYFVELKVEGVWRDAAEGFEGANWYALFIVHTMAPVAGWGTILTIYLGWLATFGVIWAAFVWFMRRQSTVVSKPATVKPAVEPAAASKPAATALVAAPKPVATPASKPVPPPLQIPKPVPPQPTPVPLAKKPVLVPVSQPVPIPRVVEVHPNHTMLPMIPELDLPAPRVGVQTPVPPAPAPAAPAPKPLAPIQIVPEAPKSTVQMPNLNESGLPALHVMPKRPEDIESSRRGPVIKMNGDI